MDTSDCHFSGVAGNGCWAHTTAFSLQEMRVKCSIYFVLLYKLHEI